MTAFFYTLNSLLNKNDITKNKFLNDLKLDENSFTEWDLHCYKEMQKNKHE